MAAQADALAAAQRREVERRQDALMRSARAAARRACEWAFEICGRADDEMRKTRLRLDEAELARSAQVGVEWEAAFRMRRLAREAGMTL